MRNLVFRCLLFVPGDSQAKLQKAFGLSVDAVVIDWEDAVLPVDKAAAREITLGALRRRSPGQIVIVRTNPVDSEAFPTDREALADLPRETLPSGVMIPKCSSSEEMLEAAAFLDQVDPARGCGLYAVIESARGVVNVSDIVMADDRIAAAAFGAEDFSAETGIRRGADDCELLYARSAVVTAARAAGREAYDSPSMDFRNLDKVRAAAERARDLGFSGQMAIHPAQATIVREVFTPGAEETAEARRLLAAFEQQERGVTAVDGRLVDEPVLKRARRILTFAGTCHSPFSSSDPETP